MTPNPEAISLLDDLSQLGGDAGLITLLQHAAQTVLNQHNASGDGLSIVISDNEQVRQLNLTYRGIDAPTDVLSFPAELPDDLPEELAEYDDETEEDEEDEEDDVYDDETEEGAYLGDLVIAYPYASAQAQALGHPLRDSLALLVVHGTLHLLGYDHDTPENRAEMWQAQADALTALGVPLDVVPALEDAP